MKQMLKRLAVVVLAFAVAVGVFTPAQAQAAKKIKAVYGEDNAKAVKKGKTYIVTSKQYFSGKGLTYIKFTAPKTGKYKFIFSGLTKHGEKTEECIMNGCVSLKAYDDYGYLSPIKLDFGKGQTGDTLYICSEYSGTIGDKDEKDMYEYLPGRFAALKLTKGTTVYIAFNFIDTCDVKLQIK